MGNRCWSSAKTENDCTTQILRSGICCVCFLFEPQTHPQILCAGILSAPNPSSCKIHIQFKAPQTRTRRKSVPIQAPCLTPFSASCGRNGHRNWNSTSGCQPKYLMINRVVPAYWPTKIAILNPSTYLLGPLDQEVSQRVKDGHRQGFEPLHVKVSWTSYVHDIPGPKIRIFVWLP